MANDNLKWNVGVVVAILVLAASAIAAFAVLSDDVGEMWPEVKQNTEHRIKFEEKVDNIDEKVDSISRDVKLILLKIREK